MSALKGLKAEALTTEARPKLKLPREQWAEHTVDWSLPAGEAR